MQNDFDESHKLLQLDKLSKLLDEKIKHYKTIAEIAARCLNDVIPNIDAFDFYINDNVSCKLSVLLD